MPFLRANIDRAIVMTQYDLRGFLHPLGFREPYKASPKSLHAIACNLAACAAGFGLRDEKPTVENFPDCFDTSYEEYLVMCKHFAEDCDTFQKEAIKLIVQEILKQSEEMKADIAEGTREPSHYLQPLEKDNIWGKAVLSLIEAFEVSLPEPVVT